MLGTALSGGKNTEYSGTCPEIKDYLVFDSILISFNSF
jgi:hypothetical protein